MLKSHLRRYIREHGLMDAAFPRVEADYILPMHLHSLQELNGQVSDFFDEALYALALGYESSRVLTTTSKSILKAAPVTTISRRIFLQAVAAATAAVPAFAQEPTAPRANQAPRDTTPLVPPFESTGWKTVWLDHLNYQCMDYRKAAAFYATLMGWKVRSDDGKQALLDIGDSSGGILIRGGLARAATCGDHRRGPRCGAAAGAGGVRWLRVGHRPMGHR